ncbi:hypothetical protein ACIGXI_09100 [Kitasatospora aureofaciens]|uniref:hypothetical protein n=1 Tax=Kitasatospora aureofaciens TaxID=1894 RepID=UPI0037C86A93
MASDLTTGVDALSAARRTLEQMAVEQPIPDELTVEDIVLVERDAWNRIRESGGVLEAPGHRIYVLSFLGPVPYIRAGRTQAAQSRIENHVREAHRHLCFLADGWVSKARAMDIGGIENAMHRALSTAGGVTLSSREVFHGLDFETAVQVAQGVLRR